MVFNNNASNQDNNRNDNNSNQDNKSHKEAMRIRWGFQMIFRSDDKTNPAEAGFIINALTL